MARLLVLLVATFCVIGSADASTGPVLDIPDQIPGMFGDPVAVPVLFSGNGSDISASIFSVDLDEGCLHFDAVDADFDGIPDDVLFRLPIQFTGSVTFDPTDQDGELDFVIADFGPPLASLSDGVIAFVIVTPTCRSGQAAVRFAVNPPASFGDSGGRGVPGTSNDGAVAISEEVFSDGFESGGLSAWSNSSASAQSAE